MSSPPPFPGPFPERPGESTTGPREQPVRSPFGDTPPTPTDQPAPFAQPAAPKPYGQPNPYGQLGQYGEPIPYAQPTAYGQPGPYGPSGQQAPPGYQPYGSPQPYAPTRTNGLAVTSMVLGICGVVLFCLYAIPCVLAIIFGAIALNQFKTQPNVYTGRGMAVAGLVLGLVGVGLLILVVAAGNGFSVID